MSGGNNVLVDLPGRKAGSYGTMLTIRAGLVMGAGRVLAKVLTVLFGTASCLDFCNATGSCDCRPL